MTFTPSYSADQMKIIRSDAVAHAGRFDVTVRLTPLMTLLLAGGLAMLLASVPAAAARLPASAPTPITLSAYQSIPVTQTSTGTAMREHPASPETETGTSSADQGEKTGGDPAAAPVTSEFSSLDTAVFVPSSAPVRASHASDTDQSDTADNGAASMPLVALAWLFGIGIIGMGTVGRRRKQP